MPVIYEPRGAAREYSPLALNLYRGCSHGCRYCYAPAVLRTTREEFARDPQPRPGVLEQLEKDIAVLAAPAKLAAAGDTRPILLSFTSDPYQPCERKHSVTRRALKILLDAGLHVRILTKAGGLPQWDFPLFKGREHLVEFGVTLLFTQEASRVKWEPFADSLANRRQALEVAKRLGLRTWVSVEPVIYPGQAAEVLDLDCVDTFKVGKLNHDKAGEASIDWRQFLTWALERLNAPGRTCGYYIKNDLWAFADKGMRIRWPKEREALA